MRPALPAWLLLATSLVAAPTPYVDKKSAVADEAWMNARVKAGEVLQSGQQLDPEGTLIDVSGRPTSPTPCAPRRAPPSPA